MLWAVGKIAAIPSVSRAMSHRLTTFDFIENPPIALR